MKLLAAATFLLFSCSVPAVCQLPQSRPEFCGLPGGMVQVPAGVSAEVTSERGRSDLFVHPGAPAIRLPLYDVRIDQICPLPDGRLVAFGFPLNGTSINVVDTQSATLIDAFMSYHPVMSPDRRWIAFLKYYPRGAELPTSDEYLLYDLSKSPAQNRPSGQYSGEALDFDVGAAIYPNGWKNEPGDNIGAPAELRHFSLSTFFWAADSSEVLFADTSGRGSRIVRVSIGPDGATSASVYDLPTTLPCADNRADEETEWKAVRKIELGPKQALDQLVWVDFDTNGCVARTLQLHSDDFKPATAEIRPPEQPGKTAKKLH